MNTNTSQRVRTRHPADAERDRVFLWIAGILLGLVGLACGLCYLFALAWVDHFQF